MASGLSDRYWNRTVESTRLSYRAAEYWTERFRRYGHTGDTDPVVFDYDQPQRLRVIERALARARVPLNAATRVLDIGCGTGDVIELLRTHGVRHVTGLDCSEEVVAFTRRRFAGWEGELDLRVGLLEEFEPPVHSCDLVASINALQHVTDDAVLPHIIGRLSRALEPGGHVVLMEFSPIRVRQRHPSDYVVVRSRGEYLRLFRAAGLWPAVELALPRLGVRAWRRVIRLGAATFALMGWPPRSSVVAGEAAPVAAARAEEAPAVARAVRAAILAVARPLDQGLRWFPSGLTDMRVLVFARGGARG